MVFGAEGERLKVSTQLQLLMLKTTNPARKLGAVMNSDLNLNSHLKTVTKSPYYLLKNISRIQDLFLNRIWKKLRWSSVVDYCNGVFTGLCKNSVNPNAAA